MKAEDLMLNQNFPLHCGGLVSYTEQHGGMFIVKQRFETKDIILGKAKQEDLHSIYNNYWNSETSARYMFWVPQKNLAEAQDRLNRTINFQKSNYAYFIYEKKTGEAIGQAAMVELDDGVWQDGGIGMGEKFVGKGYGKQILNCFIDYLFTEKNAKKILCSCHPDNNPSRQLQLSCGLKFSHLEEVKREKDNEPYLYEFYSIDRSEWNKLRDKSKREN